MWFLFELILAGPILCPKGRQTAAADCADPSQRANITNIRHSQQPFSAKHLARKRNFADQSSTTMFVSKVFEGA